MDITVPVWLLWACGALAALGVIHVILVIGALAVFGWVLLKPFDPPEVAKRPKVG